MMVCRPSSSTANFELILCSQLRSQVRSTPSLDYCNHSRPMWNHDNESERWTQSSKPSTRNLASSTKSSSRSSCTSPSSFSSNAPRLNCSAVSCSACRKMQGKMYERRFIDSCDISSSTSTTSMSYECAILSYSSYGQSSSPFCIIASKSFATDRSRGIINSKTKRSKRCDLSDVSSRSRTQNAPST